MAKPKHKRHKIHPGGGEQHDHIAHGSEEHARILMLRPAREGDTYVVEDSKKRKWTLLDPTAYGPQATEAYIREVLRQKVSELDTPMPQVQSTDRLAPGYAPPMWVPPPGFE